MGQTAAATMLTVEEREKLIATKRESLLQEAVKKYRQWNGGHDPPEALLERLRTDLVIDPQPRSGSQHVDYYFSLPEREDRFRSVLQLLSYLSAMFPPEDEEDEEEDGQEAASGSDGKGSDGKGSDGKGSDGKGSDGKGKKPLEDLVYLLQSDSEESEESDEKEGKRRHGQKRQRGDADDASQDTVSINPSKQNKQNKQAQVPASPTSRPKEQVTGTPSGSQRKKVPAGAADAAATPPIQQGQRVPDELQREQLTQLTQLTPAEASSAPGLLLQKRRKVSVPHKLGPGLVRRAATEPKPAPAPAASLAALEQITEAVHADAARLARLAKEVADLEVEVEEVQKEAQLHAQARLKNHGRAEALQLEKDQLARRLADYRTNVMDTEQMWTMFETLRKARLGRGGVGDFFDLLATCAWVLEEHASVAAKPPGSLVELFFERLGLESTPANVATALQDLQTIGASVGGLPPLFGIMLRAAESELRGDIQRQTLEQSAEAPEQTK